MHYRLVKRLIDVAVSALVLLLLAPLLLALAVLVRIDSPGNPLFSQVRVGRGGRVFTMLKFRSMVKNADKIGSYSTADNDARITRMGAFLRKTSLDELPQLINVLTGDMSLVGPRPDVPAQQGNYLPQHWKRRLGVQPGVTGLAQVNGRSNVTPKKRLAYDLLYARRMSLLLDMRIVLKTVAMVLKREGVN